MKTTFLLLLFFIFSFGSLTAQHSHQCSHRASFEKSWISDTLDALTYTIHLNEFDFTNQEITASYGN